MNSFQTDENNQEILLSKDDQQVMMEWEKPYMEKSIDFLNPEGHILEIGFGCGYSATQFMKHTPKSYTVIECDPIVVKKAKIWAEKYDIPINVVQGEWQNKLSNLGKFDQIYFDDFPLNITKKSTEIEVVLSQKRLDTFISLCLQNHMHLGSKISCYLNSNNKIILNSDIKPFVEVFYKSIDIHIPENCKYRDTKEQKCLIPLIVKIKDYNFEYANRIAHQEILKKLESQSCSNK